jgi:hypothetical protein
MIEQRWRFIGLSVLFSSFALRQASTPFAGSFKIEPVGEDAICT